MNSYRSTSLITYNEMYKYQVVIVSLQEIFMLTQKCKYFLEQHNISSTILLYLKLSLSDLNDVLRRLKIDIISINLMYQQDKCCGVFTYADWRATIYGGHRYDKVPDSCCKTEEYACGFKFKDEATLNKMVKFCCFISKIPLLPLSLK